jgi:hypothetical protein
MVAAQRTNDHPHFPPSSALDTLDQVADRAYAALGPCDGRLARAVAIVRSGAVTLLPTGDVEVQSQTTDELTYTVNGSCPCPDATHRAPNGHCKHLLAAWLVRRVHNALPQAPTAQTPTEPAPVPLPEAPASVNCHITVEGRQVQITLRDTDETRLLGRLAAILRQYPLAETHQPTHQHNGSQASWCALHGVPMKQNQKAGRSWYSHKTATGWCQGR